VTTFNPQSTDERPLKTAIERITGSEPTAVEMAYHRRLHFDAHAMTIADARLRVEAPAMGDDSAIRKLPAPERTDRYEKQRTRLTGLVWSLTLEPSHRLLDKAQQQIEENTASYISLDQCTCRQQELAGVRKESVVKIDPVTGAMSFSEKQSDEWANTSSDHNLRMAFRRRALAYDQSNLATYEVMETWTERLFSAMMDPPPAGYSAPTRDRILAADRQLFAKVVEACRSGVLPKAVGASILLPIEVAMEKFADHPTVIFNLLPLPSISQSSKRQFEPASSSEPQSKRKRGNAGRRSKDKANSPTQAEPDKPAKGKGKGKKGVGKSKEQPLPPALQGCWRTVKGKKACVYFNMAICENHAAPGEECRQGIHLCMTPQCGEGHPAVMCPKRVSREGKE
jgi:hypothetical protein